MIVSPLVLYLSALGVPYFEIQFLEKKHILFEFKFHWRLDGLVQEGSNSSALTMELRLSCTNPSICP